MKKIFTILVFASSFVLAQGVVVITQYYEGASSDKWIEIRNVGNATVDFSVTPHYVLLYSNASADDPANNSPNSTYEITGTMGPNGGFLLQNSSAVNPSYANGVNSGVANFNGDDIVAISTSNSSTSGVAWAARTDVIGDGTSWGSNTSFSRKVTAISPTTSYTPSNWDEYSNSDVDNASSSNNEYLGTFSGYTPLPVELTSFTASILDDAVNLNWETATEVNNYGFDIERQYQIASSKNQEWAKVGFVRGHGNSNSPKYYSFADNSLTEDGDYSYRLKQVDIDGQFEYSYVVNVSFTSPLEFELGQNYPNPFNPNTQISFTLPNSDEVRLTVYNILGEEVARLVNASLDAGQHTVEFNAEELNSGVYVYKLETSDYFETRKMILMK